MSESKSLPLHDWEQDTCTKCGDKDYLSPDKYCSEVKLKDSPRPPPRPPKPPKRPASRDVHQDKRSQIMRVPARVIDIIGWVFFFAGVVVGWFIGHMIAIL
jgi:hypothetical protein